MLVTVERPNRVTPVSNGTVGDRIRQRREAMGWDIKALAKLANVDRGQLAKIERGEHIPRGATLGAIERALDEIEKETGHDEPDAGLVTFRLSGNFGVDVVVQGPVSNIEELEESVARLVRTMKKDEPES